MLDYKFRRQTFYALNPDLTDLLDECKIQLIIDYESIVEDAINYAISHDPVMRYPGKSYSIAVHYASWIEDFFGHDFYEVLSDPDLLPDDPFFVPYQKDKDTYDEIISLLDSINHVISEERQPYLKMTREYFLQEFMLDEQGQSILPL